MLEIKTDEGMCPMYSYRNIAVNGESKLRQLPAVNCPYNTFPQQHKEIKLFLALEGTLQTMAAHVDLIFLEMIVRNLLDLL